MISKHNIPVLLELENLFEIFVFFRLDLHCHAIWINVGLERDHCHCEEFRRWWSSSRLILKLRDKGPLVINVWWIDHELFLDSVPLTLWHFLQLIAHDSSKVLRRVKFELLVIIIISRNATEVNSGRTVNILEPLLWDELIKPFYLIVQKISHWRLSLQLNYILIIVWLNGVLDWHAMNTIVVYYITELAVPTIFP